MSEETKPRKKKRWPRVVAILFAVGVVVYWLLGHIVNAMDPAALERFRNALHSAPVIAVIPTEHRQQVNDEGTRLVLHYFEEQLVQLNDSQREAAVAVVGRSQKLTPGQLAIGMTRCFYPHYALSARHADGSSEELIICFDCSNVALLHRDAGGEIDFHDYRLTKMPGRWRGPLREFLQSLGFTEHLSGSD